MIYYKVSISTGMPVGLGRDAQLSVRNLIYF